VKKLTKRDIKIFFLGMLTVILIEIVFDWDRTVDDAVRGFNAGRAAVTGN
jgi:hypothetical protein